MTKLDEISESIRLAFETRTTERDRALAQTRTLTRTCAHAIRAIHRNEVSLAQQSLEEAHLLAVGLSENLAAFPDLFYAGYTQDALKEFAEAHLVFALVYDQPIPTPQDLGLEPATYLKGMAEAATELRRRCLDALLKDDPAEASRMLQEMDEIYSLLVTMDFPDAITGGLRRLTDILRSVTERTRGDLTLSLRQEKLEKSLKQLESRLENIKG